MKLTDTDALNRMLFPHVFAIPPHSLTLLNEGLPVAADAELLLVGFECGLSVWCGEVCGAADPYGQRQGCQRRASHGVLRPHPHQEGRDCGQQHGGDTAAVCFQVQPVQRDQQGDQGQAMQVQAGEEEQAGAQAGQDDQVAAEVTGVEVRASHQLRAGARVVLEAGDGGALGLQVSQCQCRAAGQDHAAQHHPLTRSGGGQQVKADGRTDDGRPHASPAVRFPLVGSPGGAEPDPAQEQQG